MPALTPQAAALLKDQALVRSYELVRAGLDRKQIARLVAGGELKRIGRCLYARPDYQPDTQEGLIMVAKRAPGVVFCLLTALRFHELTTQAPFQIWIGIGQDAKPPRMDYPPVRAIRYSQASLQVGVTAHTLDHTTVRVTDVAKTVADCFKYRNRVGLDVALEALREAFHERRLDMNALWSYAKTNRVAKVMQPYLEFLA